MVDLLNRVAELLAESDCRHAFGVTGSGSTLQLITAMQAAGIHYRPVGHEAAAAIMAGTVSRAARTPAVSLSIKGPGLANMLPGIVSNHYENSPALSISEAYGADAPSHRMHKRLDHAGMLGPVTKGMLSINEVERLPELLSRGREEVPGPVHLELARGHARWEKDKLESSVQNPERAESEYGAVLELIRRAHRPAVVVGSYAVRQRWEEPLRQLPCPLFTTVAAKGIVDERAPYSAGVYTGVGGGLVPETELLAEADVVLGIGLRNAEVLAAKPIGQRLVIVDELGSLAAAAFTDEIFTMRPESIRCLVDELPAIIEEWGEDRIRDIREKLRRHLLGAGWLPAVCFEALNNLDHAHALVLDTGSFCTIGEHIWASSPDRPFVGSSNGRYMGVSIPSAIGLSIARPDIPVFCAVGDGGVGMYLPEIRLAVAERLPVCVILMTDGRYGSVACAPGALGLAPYAYTFSNVSWWKAVAAMGCEAREVVGPVEFVQYIREWRREAPLFLEVPFDAELYLHMTQNVR